MCRQPTIQSSLDKKSLTRVAHPSSAKEARHVNRALTKIISSRWVAKSAIFHALRLWLRKRSARLSTRLHPPELADGDHESENFPESRYACVLAMFRRATEPLDGVHPALVRLLAHNSDRDAALNAELTRLFEEAEAWQIRAECAVQAMHDLMPFLEDAQIRAEWAEAQSSADQAALVQSQAEYVAYCASQLNDLTVDGSNEDSPPVARPQKPVLVFPDPPVFKPALSRQEGREQLRLVG